MQLVPYNGHLEIWLQRVTKAKGVELDFDSTEPICQIVSGKPAPLWNNDWIDNGDLLTALDTNKILIGKPEDLAAIPSTDELSLFRQYSEFS